jgi:hypothetical protein
MLLTATSVLAIVSFENGLTVVVGELLYNRNTVLERSQYGSQWI